MGRVPKLISEAILPIPGTADVTAMARGEPGLPAGFVWRGNTYRIKACERTWKLHRPESSGKELYLRRHYYSVRMDGGAHWTVYCLRQPPTAGSVGGRWYLYTIG